VEIHAQIPDVSRYGASIIDEILGCLDRATATHVSFYLSIPTLGAASLADLIRIVDQLSPGHLGRLALGTCILLSIAGSVLAGFSATSSTTASGSIYTF
jgi:undecaprenyl-diphosphatase